MEKNFINKKKIIFISTIILLGLFLGLKVIGRESPFLFNKEILSKTPFNRSNTLPRGSQGKIRVEDFTKESKSPAENKGYVKGEVLVKFRENKINLQTLTGKVRSNIFSFSNHLKKALDIQRNNLSLFKIEDAKSIGEKIKELKNNPYVEYAQPNYRYYPFATSVNDTRFSSQWSLNNTGQTVNGTTGTADADIDMPEAWDLETSSWSDTTVAVIDSGAMYNHPDQKDSLLVSSYDFENNDPIPDDLLDIYGGGHGTHVAGIIAAKSNNSLGVSGLSRNNHLKIMFLKTDYTTAQIVSAINYAQVHGAKAINASWGCTTPDRGGTQMVCGEIPGYDYSDQSLYDAIGNFNGLFIAAAGNGNGDTDPEGDDHKGEGEYQVYPCDHDLDNIICVAATDQNDNLASFSDYCATSVDVGAPGTNVLSTYPKSDVAFEEDFSGVTPPDVGDQFTLEGDPNWWGTYDTGGGFNVLYSDYFNVPYEPNIDAYIVSDPIDLTKNSIYSAHLFFYMHCDTPQDNAETWTDYVSLEVSDGTNWHEVGRYDADILNPSYLYVVAPDISLYRNSNFRFRFYWHTDAADNNYDGCYIILPSAFIHDMDNAYEYLDGTSMAAPHVTALAGLLWSYKPTLTAAQVKSAILNTGDTKASLVDKTVTGKRINAYGALKSLDTTAPNGSISISNGATYTKSSAVVLKLSATDSGFGMGQMRLSNNGSTWGGWRTYAYTTSYSWNLTSSTYGGNTAEGTKRVYVQYKDKVGNVSSAKSDTIIYDKTAPTGWIKINNGAYSTTSKYVTLYISATDNKSGVGYMRISNNNSKWTGWITYKTRYSWGLTSSTYGGSTAKGTKKVYVQFRDKAGNISSKKYDTIVYK